MACRSRNDASASRSCERGARLRCKPSSSIVNYRQRSSRVATSQLESSWYLHEIRGLEYVDGLANLLNERMNQSLCKARRTRDRKKRAGSKEGQEHGIQRAERQEAANNRGNRTIGKTNANRYKGNKERQQRNRTHQARVVRCPAIALPSMIPHIQHILWLRIGYHGLRWSVASGPLLR
jgi:hypothetical protein